MQVMSGGKYDIDCVDFTYSLNSKYSTYFGVCLLHDNEEKAVS